MSKNRPKIHFLGVGGIGMSALATMMCKRGYKVSGCDCAIPDKSVERILLESGVHFLCGHDVCHVRSVDCLIYTSAVRCNHPEIIEAHSNGICVMHRSELLSEILTESKCSIAIAGAHGKTSTAAFVAWVLYASGLDPTCIIGGVSNNFSSNMKLGLNRYLVVEADESDRSFLRYKPSISVITNIDTDHMDTYKNLGDIEETFTQFIKNTDEKKGLIVACSDSDSVRTILKAINRKVITYGILGEYNPDLIARKVVEKGIKSQFEVIWKGRPLGKAAITIPGNHSILNALASVAVGLELGIDFEKIVGALSKFRGVERRFEFKGKFNGAKIFDDYAHHPVEMSMAVSVARKLAKNRLFIAFQPHRFTRTQRLWNEFVDLFHKIETDHVFVFDIYPASEDIIEGICSERLVKDIQKGSVSEVVYSHSFGETATLLQKELSKGDILLTLGAGYAYKVGEKLLGG